MHKDSKRSVNGNRMSGPQTSIIYPWFYVVKGSVVKKTTSPWKLGRAEVDVGWIVFGGKRAHLGGRQRGEGKVLLWRVNEERDVKTQKRGGGSGEKTNGVIP